ncbi:hypothetical protein VSDG_01188 [Cytospora chrysosperma]|uniref:Uncharacterized protein n=1 Tax=Cytospora chrysosperma TaxID=252740 RepID=A0A423WL72_CYTCH|nr:hypothetical protein VSDG_01188 [Valsa sordida]
MGLYGAMTLLGTTPKLVMKLHSDGDFLSHRVVINYVEPPQKECRYAVHLSLLSSKSEFKSVNPRWFPSLARGVVLPLAGLKSLA